MNDEEKAELVTKLTTHYKNKTDYEGQIIVSYEYNNILGPDHHKYIMIPRTLFPKFGE